MNNDLARIMDFVITCAGNGQQSYHLTNAYVAAELYYELCDQEGVAP